MNSWPRMSPGSMDGTAPCSRCRSEPQIAARLTLTIASRGFLILGSGTVSTRTSFLPYQQQAFMVCPPIRITLQETSCSCGCAAHDGASLAGKDCSDADSTVSG